jgi:hypothetical protein
LFEDDKPHRGVFGDINGKPHETVDMEYEGQKVPIDKEIAPLVDKLWKAGYRTLNSCQNSGRLLHTYLHFAQHSHAKAFFDAVYRHVSVTVWQNSQGDSATVRFPYKELAAVTALDFPPVQQG